MPDPCFFCGARGHWYKDCPVRNGAGTPKKTTPKKEEPDNDQPPAAQATPPRKRTIREIRADLERILVKEEELREEYVQALAMKLAKEMQEKAFEEAIAKMKRGRDEDGDDDPRDDAEEAQLEPQAAT